MRILLRFACGFVAAAVLALTVFPVWAALAAAAALLVPGAVLCRRYRGLGPVLLGLCAGLLWTTGYQALAQRNALPPSEEPVMISGVATDYSTETAYGVRVPATITDGGRSARAVVWLYADQLKPGDRFTVSAVLRAPEDNYYRSEGFSLLAFGKGTPELAPAERVPLRYLPRRIARRLEQSLVRAVPADALGYAVALTTGNRDRLTKLEKQNMQTAGVYHALALSGMHVSILMGMLAPLTRSRRSRAAVGIPVCVAFALMTGASASIVRAAVMQCLLLLAPLTGREEDAPTSLGLAALLLTMQNPWCVFGWGMQLSFASVAGILLCSDRLYRLLRGSRRREKRRRKGVRRLRRWAFSSVSATASAMLFTTPLCMAYFGRVSLASLLANLLTGWAVEWCFRGSLLTALLGIALPRLAGILGLGLGWLVRYVKLVTALLAGVPFASLSTRTIFGVGWVIQVYAVTLLTVLLPGRKRPVIPACCILAGLIVCMTGTLLQNGGFSMTVLDVGQGQCVILTSRGRTALVDCGGSLGEGVGDLAANYLSDRGETRVDALILTHFDSDHVGGVQELLDRMDVAQVIVPDVEAERLERLRVEAAARNEGAALLVLSEQETLSFGDGTLTLFPADPAASANSCLGVLAEAGDNRALITGDMDERQERRLLTAWSLPEVDILVAGHHGSADSTSEALLTAVKPEIVAISVGRNSYGHPAGETLARIAQAGATLYRTDQNGTIELKGG